MYREEGKSRKIFVTALKEVEEQTTG